MHTEFKNFRLAEIFAYPSLITASRLDKLANVGGNLLRNSNKYKNKLCPPITRASNYNVTYSNKILAARSPGLPDPNHSKFQLPSRKGDLKRWNTIEQPTTYAAMMLWKKVNSVRCWSWSRVEPLEANYSLVHIYLLITRCLPRHQCLKPSSIFELKYTI